MKIILNCSTASLLFALHLFLTIPPRANNSSALVFLKCSRFFPSGSLPKLNPSKNSIQTHHTSTILYVLCSSVVRASHLSRRAAHSGSQEGEAGAALPWQRHDVWRPVQVEVAEGEGSQAGGRGGGGRRCLCQGVSSAGLPHGSLCVCQQQHTGTQLHLCICERWVLKVAGRHVIAHVCPITSINPSLFQLLRPTECLPAHHGERHPGACRWELHHPLSCDRPRGHPPGFGDLRWTAFALWHEFPQQPPERRHHQQCEEGIWGLLRLCGTA